MVITPVKTRPVVRGDKIENILDRYISNIEENSIVVVTSKIISTCEGRVVPINSANKDDLVKKEAEFYLPRTESKYDFMITIKNSMIVASAGIDESNGNGCYVLWPRDPQRSANLIREHLSKKFKIKNLGVIITDSKLSPLRWGVTGYTLAHSGFKVLKNYIGKTDIFGRKLKAEKLNVADSLASASIAVMGEGDEQTPISIIEQTPFVEFQQRNPTKKELNALRIDIKDDIYAPILESVNWLKGKK